MPWQMPWKSASALKEHRGKKDLKGRSRPVGWISPQKTLQAQTVSLVLRHSAARCFVQVTFMEMSLVQLENTTWGLPALDEVLCSGL